MGRITEVFIIEELCLLHGMCVPECPEVFRIRDGDSFASITPNAEKYFETLDGDIRSAMECCPMSCIQVVEVDDSSP